MKVPLVFKSNESSSSWLWGACNHPKTLSFRANNNSNIFKTMNNVNVFTNTPASVNETKLPHRNTGRGGGNEGEESIETLIKGISSNRFFFEVSSETSSILEEAKKEDDDVALFKESVTMEMESRDPFVDFRKSMEEMIEANHELLLKNNDDNWDFLEELLACYLKVNHKSHHGYIVGAFVDLLVDIEFAYSSEDQCCSSSSIANGGDGGGGGCGGDSFTSPLSFYSSTNSTSPCLSSLMESGDEIEKSEENASKSSTLILTNV